MEIDEAIKHERWEARHAGLESCRGYIVTDGSATIPSYMGIGVYT